MSLKINDFQAHERVFSMKITLRLPFHGILVMASKRHQQLLPVYRHGTG
jgi:hypothetical protein